MLLWFVRWGADLGAGTVIVFTGILPLAKDEEGLAAVVGHGKCDITLDSDDHSCSHPLEIAHAGWRTA